MIEFISQAAILSLGVIANFMVGTKGKWRKWGFVVGLCSQPFWVITGYKNDQWGIMILSIFYVFTWANGIRNNFGK